MRGIFVILITFICCQAAWPSDLVLKKRVATSLNTITLHRDSNFTKATNIAFREGTLFEIISESKLEHEDAAQNQKFKWFEVRTEKGKHGWVFGDGLAVILPEQFVDEGLRHFHKKRCKFSNGFERSISWLASVDGRDNFHEQDFMNPLYRELYLVVTNDRGRSVHIQYAGLSARGEMSLKQLVLQDVTGDKVPEVILLTANQPEGSVVMSQELAVFSFQAGTLRQVIEEELTLKYSPHQPAPSLYKFVELEEKTVRIAYVDYISCAEYKLPYKTDSRPGANERCLEYVTYTFLWNSRLNEFEQFYQPSRSALQAVVLQQSMLKNIPSKRAMNIGRVGRNESLKVLKHSEQFVKENGRKKVQLYLYVERHNGRTGYIPAAQLRFVNCESADLLNAYYQNPPLSKSAWKTDQPFLKILPKESASTAVSGQ